MNRDGNGNFSATAITDSNGNTVGTATYISDGGLTDYANRNGIDFINTQTAPVVNAMGWATVGSVGVMMGAEVAPVVAEASAALRYQAALQAWKTLSAATGAAGLINKFFKTGEVPPGLTPEMMSAYLNLAKTYISAGLGTAGGIMQSGIGTQANRIQQLENYLGGSLMAAPTDQSLFVVLGLDRGSTPAPRGQRRDRVDDTKYALLEREVGFYDFLRNRQKVLIGLRFSFFRKEKILNDAADLDYVYVDPKRQYMEVYLKDYRSAAEGPAEQAFGDDALWRSSQGIYALQVGTAELSDGDMEVLRQIAQAG